MRIAVKRSAARLAACVCLALCVGFAVQAFARSPSCERVERYTLKNGLEVVLLPDRGLPHVALVSSVHAGARHDPPGYEGLAHYVEHLTFREALGLGKVDELYKEAGATRVNAFTRLDTTDYVAQLPRAQLERGLWIEARRLAVGLDVLTPSQVAEEHQVVLREHELRFGSSLGLEMLTATFLQFYPAGHPYHELRTQTEASVGALTLEDARWFFARYYRPDRIRLTLVGDFDTASAKALIEKYFAALAPRPLPRASSAPAQSEAEAVAAECRRAEVRALPPYGSVVVSRRGREQAVLFLWHPPAGEDAQRYAGVLDAFRGRVADAARSAKLAGDARLARESTEFGDFWQLSVELLPAQPFERVEPLVKTIFEELKRTPLDPSEQNAQRQALVLHEAERRMYLARALDLSRRECRPSRCLAAEELISPETMAGLEHFDPARALRVEIRHSVSASIDGDVERVP